MQLALPIEWLPATGAAEQLILLLHGGGEDARAMLPLAQALRSAFPQAAVLAPDAPHAAPEGPGACRWYDPEEPLEQATAAALPRLLDWVRRMQQQQRVGPAATAVAGFSQGANLALALAMTHDGAAGRVLAFSGRLAGVPAQAPRDTTLHLFHGAADDITPVVHAHEALELLGVLRGDATLDIAQGVGHVLHPALVQRALFRLSSHIPARTWAQALGAAPR